MAEDQVSKIKQLDESIKEASRNGDDSRRNTLRMIKSGAVDIGKNAKVGKEFAPREPTDDDVTAAAKSLLKKNRESLEFARQLGRTDQESKLLREIEVIESTLPATMDEAEIEKVVREVVAETKAEGQKSMGLVIKAMRERLGDRFDGATMSPVVKRVLG